MSRARRTSKARYACHPGCVGDRILEKLNAEYKAKIEQQQQELARTAEEQKAQAEALEAINAELEAVKKGKR